MSEKNPNGFFSFFTVFQKEMTENCIILGFYNPFSLRPFAEGFNHIEPKLTQSDCQHNLSQSSISSTYQVFKFFSYCFFMKHFLVDIENIDLFLYQKTLGKLIAF
jgi:hypothetical protein